MKASAILTALLLSASIGSIGASTARAADDPLETAKSLYMSASYQEALAVLANLPAGADVDLADKYRALCLLGLNRPDDAEKAIEQLLIRRPFFQVDPLDSPKLVAMLKDARTRLIPVTAKSLYAGAKEAFEKGELEKASDQFADLMKLLAEPEAAGEAGLADLRILADGFAKLTEQRLAGDRAAAKATAPPPPAPPPVPAVPRIFTAGDPDVVPPTPLLQNIPQWVPPQSGLRMQTFSGAVEIVIDEQGAVTDAAIVEPVNAYYDQLLLAATNKWRYKPATRAGQPVKYRRTIAVTLKPPTSDAPAGTSTQS
jgi:TonB family protein